MLTTIETADFTGGPWTDWAPGPGEVLAVGSDGMGSELLTVWLAVRLPGGGWRLYVGRHRPIPVVESFFWRALRLAFRGRPNVH